MKRFTLVIGMWVIGMILILNAQLPAQTKEAPASIAAALLVKVITRIV